MTKKAPRISSLSIFFPAYNEAENIVLALRQAIAIAPKLSDIYEIIVIIDGSTDATAAMVKKCIERHPHIRLISQRNRGYGGALKRGFKEAKYDWIFFTDSDRQFDLRELQQFVALTPENDAVIGYRTSRAEGLKRLLLAKALKIWNRVLLGFPSEIKDIDCAFKLIRKDVLREIEPLFSNGAMISTELLLKLYYGQFQISQVGVSHFPRRFGHPTGSNLTVIGKAIQDTFVLQHKLIHSRLCNRHRKLTLRWQGLTDILAINLKSVINRAD